MRIGEVDFPEPLISAQKGGSLVVFAGAGVSKSPPSNLPNFHDLADEVAGGILGRKDREPDDRFLGRLQTKGVNVNKRVCEILSNPSSLPSSLHTDLVRLFPSPSDVRLVTTNFDTHFTRAAKEFFSGGAGVEVYEAPALPLGDNFSGIVHLHGGIDKPPERMVLTDIDFGRAYLTEGWARRFLRALFARYTVLFVGYSHEDTVMQYLARGLPPDTDGPHRYALTREGNDELWNLLGVAPITFPLREGENRYGALAEAVGAWADLANKGALQHEERVKRIVEGTPPESPEESDYISEVLKDISTARFFTRYARSVEWLRWVEKEGFLCRLFKISNDNNEIDQILAWWFSENYVRQHPGDALALIQRQGQILSPLLWICIARQFSFPRESIASDILEKWVALLVGGWTHGISCDSLCLALGKLRYPEDEVAAVLLFGFLTGAYIRLEEDFFAHRETDEDEETVGAEIVLVGDQYNLGHSWEVFFRPNLAHFAGKLEPILTSRLCQAFDLLRAMGKARPGYDPDSMFRSQVEQPDSGAPKPVNFLVDAACEVLDHYIGTQPSSASGLIEKWFSLDVPFLRRLAIHGVSISRWGSDVKIDWVLQRQLLYTLGLKHEVFLLLKNAYPGASEPARRRLLDKAVEGQRVRRAGFPEDVGAYEIYNLLYWLHKSDPSCPLAEEKFTGMQREHPAFGTREEPDLDIVTKDAGPWVDISPTTPEDLVSKDPEENIEFLLTYEGKDPCGTSRDGLLGSVEQAVVKSFDWSMQLARALTKREDWKSDLWNHLILAWGRSDLEDRNWEVVLKFLLNHERVQQIAIYESSLLLEQGIEKGPNSIPSVCLNLSAGLAKKLWALLFSREDTEAEREADEWVIVAMNHPAGKLAEFSLRLVLRVREEGGVWNGIPANCRDILAAIVGGESYAAELGRVFLASQLFPLFQLDSVWTLDYILPLLDWSLSEKRAEQAWHGFVMWGKWNKDLLLLLMPLYEQTFTYLPELGKHRERFSQHLASIAIYSPLNPLDSGWLSRFLLAVAPEDRKTFASSICRVLRGADNDRRKLAWDGWMREYWQQRIDGMPALDPQELNEMVKWAPHLGPVFPEAVEKVCTGPAVSSMDSYFYHDLSDAGVAKQHPEAAAKLLLRLLAGANALEPFFQFDEIEEMVREIAASEGPPRDVLVKICDQLARLGYARAGDLKRFVENP